MKIMHIVYMTTNLRNNKKYIGVHKCTSLNDGYLGSGKMLLNAIKKYGPSFFKRDVLFIFNSSEEAFEKERELVTLEIVQSKEYYNLTVGGRGRTVYTEDDREYLSKIRKGVFTRKQENRMRQMWKEKRESGEYIRIIARNTKTGEVTKQFETIKDCAKALNLDPSSVSKACRGKLYRVKDWVFETEKYGKPKERVKHVKPDNGMKHIIKSRNRYLFRINNKVLASRKTLEEILVFKKEYFKKQGCEA